MGEEAKTEQKVAKTKLAKVLEKSEIIGVDTCVFIYHFQQDPKYSSITTALFDLLEQGKLYAYTSTLTKLEVFIEPRRQGNEDLINTYNFLLETWPGMELREFDDYVVDQAATLRAKYNITTPDAIQIASALASKATAFVTNDTALNKIREIKVTQLSDFLYSPHQ